MPDNLKRYDPRASVTDGTDTLGAVETDTVCGVDDLLGVEYSDDDMTGDVLGSLWGSIKKRASKIGHAAIKVAASKELRLGLTAVTVAFPALAPATAGLIAGAELARRVESGASDAKAAVARMKRLAARGDVTSKRALAHYTVATNARRAARAAGVGMPKGATVRPPRHNTDRWGVLTLSDGTRVRFAW